MGMFDYVEYEANCIKCGKELSWFQTKDNVCNLETLKPKDVDNFYSNCENCDTWHDFNVTRTCIVNNIEVITNN